MVDEARVPTPTGRRALLDAMADVVRAAVGARPGRRASSAVGVGIAGLVDRAGVLRVGPEPAGPARRARRATSSTAGWACRSRVDNDATCAAWGEHVAGAARGGDDVVCVTLGTGIGGGIVADGELVRGAHGFAGEAGHMVVDPHGPAVPLRAAGLLGAVRVGQRARLAGPRGGRGRPLRRGASSWPGATRGSPGRARDPGGGRGRRRGPRVVDTFAWWVALGVANLVTLLDCSLVGDRRRAWSRRATCCSTRCAAASRHVMAPDERTDVRIVAAELGERAGAVGAALLAAARPPEGAASRSAGAGRGGPDAA